MREGLPNGENRKITNFYFYNSTDTKLLQILATYFCHCHLSSSSSFLFPPLFEWIFKGLG